MKKIAAVILMMGVSIASTAALADPVPTGKYCHTMEITKDTSDSVSYLCYQGLEYVVDGKRKSCAVNKGWADRYHDGVCPRETYKF
jgi:hypothetical protein